MQEAQFKYIREFLLRHSGLVLDAEKMYLLRSRLQVVVRNNKLDSLNAIAAELRRNESGPIAKQVVDAMTTNETLFFRDKYPYDALKTFIFPELMQGVGMSKKIRIWSAASSRGQEPYSIAITASESVPRAETHVQITGTDISPTALEYAKHGLYTQMEVQRGMPVKLLVRFFSQEDMCWRVRPELRKMLKFQPANLISPKLVHSVRGAQPYDLVFCRNVLIYFSVEERRRVIDRIAQCMRKGGYLITGATEPATGIHSRWEAIRFENRNLWKLL